MRIFFDWCSLLIKFEKDETSISRGREFHKKFSDWGRQIQFEAVRVL